MMQLLLQLLLLLFGTARLVVLQWLLLPTYNAPPRLPLLA
jgi:hypothetical protein